jgi:hypothetical protein
LRRAVIDAARVMEDGFLAHIHSSGMVSNRRAKVNRQELSQELSAIAPLRLSTACPSVLKSSRKCAILTDYSAKNRQTLICGFLPKAATHF